METVDIEDVEKYIIYRTRVREVCEYVRGDKVKHRTEYKLKKGDKVIDDSRQTKIFDHVAHYKNFVCKRYNIDKYQIEVADEVEHETEKTKSLRNQRKLKLDN